MFTTALTNTDDICPQCPIYGSNVIYSTTSNGSDWYVATPFFDLTSGYCFDYGIHSQ